MSQKNRLKLDFALESNQERSSFIEKYLQEEQFQNHPPTEDELEMMGNYILWGKNAEGLNATQEKIVQIDTRYKTWNRDEIESLDMLMESPTFNENVVKPINTVPLRIKKEVFSRKKALTDCPEFMRETFENLFQQIDELDMCINLYEIKHGKRDQPPRESLSEKFSEEDLQAFNERISHWNQYKYLKMRHQLVELRREQYSLRDAFQFSHQAFVSTSQGLDREVVPQINVEIEVLPLGTSANNEIGGLLFRDWEQLIPSNYTDRELGIISSYLWDKKNYQPGANQHWIDFRDPNHVYEMFQFYFDLEDEAGDDEIEGNLGDLVDTLLFYMARADLTELQREILKQKIEKRKNTDIAREANEKWGKSYTPNYISTIFKQRIIPKINAAAEYHLKLVENIFFKEEFKVCTRCGRTLLRDADNFTRKARSNDGFTSRCKTCEKELRNNKNKNKGDEK